MTDNKQVALAITGASGAPYAQRLLEILLASNITVHLMVSAAGRIVLSDELDWKLPARAGDIQAMLAEQYGCEREQIRVYGEQQWSAPLASGSHRVPTMIVCPCTMGTLSSIAVGQSDNLINRAADVMLKENKKLILCPRETPLSLVHVKNMELLLQGGAIMLPANPYFYSGAKTLEELADTVVARVLDHIGIDHAISPRWPEERD